MNVQCERCKEIVPIGSFELLTGAIRIWCPACDEVYEVQATAPGQPKSGPDSGTMPKRERPESEGVCPKCAAVVPLGTLACDRCGLVANRFADYADSSYDVSDELKALWERCEAGWEDGAAHDQFCQEVAGAGEFRYAASRYRAASRERPGDEISRFRLKKLANMAQAAVFSGAAARKSHAEAEEQPYKGVIILFLLLLLLLAAGGVYLLVRDTA